MVRKMATGSILLLAVSSFTVGCGGQQVNLDLLTEKEAAKAQVSSLERELGETKNALEEARLDLGVAQSEAATLQDDLEAAMQDIREAPARLSSLQTEIASLQSEIASLQGEITSLQSEVSSSRNQVTTLEDRLAWEQTRRVAVVDQAPGVTWSRAFDYIASALLTKQTFVPALPVLAAVEVDIFTANPDRGDDTITMEILDDDGAALASVSVDVVAGFDGWLRFDIEGGLDVTVGSTLTIRLSDTGNMVFGWKYVEGNMYQPGSRTRYESAGGDFLFRTHGLTARQ